MTLTLDTSALVSIANTHDPQHRSVVETLASDPGPFVVPAGVLAEAAYMLEARLGPESLRAFLGDLEGGRLLLDCGDQDWSRIAEVVERYGDLPLGFADAAVVACAERRGGLVLTLDRDFEVVAGEGRIRPVPGGSE